MTSDIDLYKEWKELQVGGEFAKEKSFTRGKNPWEK